MKQSDTRPIALISMPTSSPRYPSIQLGLLKPTLERAGFPTEVFSFFMYFGSHIGWKLHEALEDITTYFPGEWIWSHHAFDSFDQEDAYIDIYRSHLETLCESAGCTLEDLLRVRRELTGSFLDLCLDWTDWSRFGLLGFTVLFQQQLATLAFARRLKERYPTLPILLGGGTMEERIGRELLRNCSQIDFVHCGEADEVFPAMVRRLHEAEPLEGLSGLLWRDGKSILGGGRGPNLLDMDKTPVPDFDEYFQAREGSGYSSYPDAPEIFLPFETSRGCWWGEKSHCTFCGLNQIGITYRSKSVGSTLDMFEQLSTRYGILNLDAVDNVLPPRFVEELFETIATAHADFRIFYAIRASFSRDQLARMWQGGLKFVQSGIESFSPHLLKLMKKGTTAMGNLEMLKWTTYLGMENVYNLLTGFPGETAQDYREQCELIALIPHLQPPYAIVRSRPDRGSPMFLHPADYSIELLPEEVYRFLYPADRFDLSIMSYYFTLKIDGMLEDEEHDHLWCMVDEWKQRWARGNRPFMFYERTMESLRISDGRGSEAQVYWYAGREAELYEYCGEARTMTAIEQRFGGQASWISKFLEESIHLNLMVPLDGRYFSLALPQNPYHGNSREDSCSRE
jgi:ribosomal peptide maturation radical SAM protein 1